MTAEQIVAELSKLGNESIRNTLLRHGGPESMFGVKVEDLKKIQKRVKKDHELALKLYDTGISDAMYLAGLIAEPERMKKSDLQRWAKKAPWHMIGDYTVPWVASESRYGAELAREWIESSKEALASSGWSTFASLVMIKPDEELDLKEIERLLDRVQKEIHTAPNRVRYMMNSFIIAVGGAVKPLVAKAKAVARAVGTVEVDMGDTACKVPLALEYIEKVEQRGTQGKKRKSARC
jgi:3-methyladenine DNA glycosylase AlkD